MPEIRIREDLFLRLLRERPSRPGMEERLSRAKAGLIAWDDESVPAGERSLKIASCDLNRPDLMTAAGIARQLRTNATGEIPSYPFFSRAGELKPATRKITVDLSVKAVRPWIAAFAAKGPGITEQVLENLDQTREVLDLHHGLNRKTVSMLAYQGGSIAWPLTYKAVRPDSVSFVPSGSDRPMNLMQILKDHPEGREHAFILENGKAFPLLVDAQGKVLSFPPVVTPKDTVGLRKGDTRIFAEFTGTDYQSVTIAASLVACDLADMGYEIEPVRIDYGYDCPDGRTIVTPWYFQKPVSTDLARIARFLGVGFNLAETANCLAKAGCLSESHGQYVTVYPPEFRNDFLHPSDVMEELMLGYGLENFEPQEPLGFSVGRLTEPELSSREISDILVGLGYQEMHSGCLGSVGDLVRKMNADGGGTVRIANPLSMDSECVRDSALPGLLASESASAGTPYPHRIFEIGPVLKMDAAANDGATTRQYAGFLQAHRESRFEEAAETVRTLLYYLGLDYTVVESDDPRFIRGHQAAVTAGGKTAGVFGEVSPDVLANWGIAMPACAGELDIHTLAASRPQ